MELKLADRATLGLLFPIRDPDFFVATFFCLLLLDLPALLMFSSIMFLPEAFVLDLRADFFKATDS
jgi:hypothetical protein